MKPVYIAVTGGGTGGHMYPLIAVIEELQHVSSSLGGDMRVRYFGAPARVYRESFHQHGVGISTIVSSKLRAYASLSNAFMPFLFAYSVLQALMKLYWFMPHAVFSKGGPGSLAVVLAAVLYRIPVIVHESDISPGRSNSIAGKFAAHIAVSYEKTKEYFSDDDKRVVVTGNPVRAALLRGVPTAARAKTSLGLHPDVPTILVINGSQGSVRINTFVLSLAAPLVKSYQVLHQTGAANYDTSKEQLRSAIGYLEEEQRTRYKLVPYFTDNLREAYAAADIIVARSGASLFEMALFGKPAILIPLKESARNHQRDNAYEYARQGGGVVIEEDNLFEGIFLNEIGKILSSPDVYHKMASAAKRFARPEAANTVARDIFQIVEGGKKT